MGSHERNERAETCEGPRETEKSRRPAHSPPAPGGTGTGEEPEALRLHLEQHHLHLGGGGRRGGPRGRTGDAGLPDLWKLHEPHPDGGRHRSRREGVGAGKG